MPLREHSSIRKLSLAYYRGWINRDRYLQIRGAYLDEVSLGQDPKPIDEADLRPTQPSPKPTPPTAKQQWLGRPSVVVIFSLFSLLIIFAGIGLFFLTAQDNPSPQKISTPTIPPPPPVSTVDTTIPSPPQEDQETAEQQLMDYIKQSFIVQERWEISRLDNLKLQWLSLTSNQQERIKKSPLFAQFSIQFSEQLSAEQKANNIVPSDYELALITIGKTLGL